MDQLSTNKRAKLFLPRQETRSASIYLYMCIAAIAIHSNCSNYKYSIVNIHIFLHTRTVKNDKAGGLVLMSQGERTGTQRPDDVIHCCLYSQISMQYQSIPQVLLLAASSFAGRSQDTIYKRIFLVCDNIHSPYLRVKVVISLMIIDLVSNYSVF